MLKADKGVLNIQLYASYERLGHICRVERNYDALVKCCSSFETLWSAIAFNGELPRTYFFHKAGVADSCC